MNIPHRVCQHAKWIEDEGICWLARMEATEGGQLFRARKHDASSHIKGKGNTPTSHARRDLNWSPSCMKADECLCNIIMTPAHCMTKRTGAMHKLRWHVKQLFKTHGNTRGWKPGVEGVGLALQLTGPLGHTSTHNSRHRRSRSSMLLQEPVSCTHQQMGLMAAAKTDLSENGHRWAGAAAEICGAIDIHTWVPAAAVDRKHLPEDLNPGCAIACMHA